MSEVGRPALPRFHGVSRTSGDAIIPPEPAAAHPYTPAWSSAAASDSPIILFAAGSLPLWMRTPSSWLSSLNVPSFLLATMFE